MRPIESRKADHIRICLEEAITPSRNHWNDVRLIHQALPEVDMEDIDTSVTVLGKRLDFPLIVTAITGGYDVARRINGNIAEACARTGAGMGVGSQRAALENGDDGSYAVIKEHDVPLVIGNVGVPQLIPQDKKGALSAEDVCRAMDMIDADAVAIHLNFLQEVVQPEGDTSSVGCLDAIGSIARDVPCLVKETGAGISRTTAQMLKGTGIRAIDIAGTGGTSFASVEMHRANARGDERRAQLGETFADWGIPSPASLLWADVGIPLIASGGIENGRHMACSLALGAVCSGTARPVLAAAMESADAVTRVLESFKAELVAAMFLVGARNLRELGQSECIIVGETRTWLEE